MNNTDGHITIIDNIHECNNSLCINKLSNNILFPYSKQKINNVSCNIPQYHEFAFFKTHKYNVTQLKLIAKSYNLKVTGNKEQLISRIYDFLFSSNSIIKIQKIFRGHLHRKYIKFHGPAFKNKSLCINNIDFLSMEHVTQIPNEQFYSYRGDDGFIYGFDLVSLHNLIYKSNGIIKNPFNTIPINSKVIEEFRSLLRLSRLLKINICVDISDVTKDVSDSKSVELRTLTVFQKMDDLGNYSNVQWFLTLNRTKLIKFTRELQNIWNYRATLTNETKRAISPPFGNPFINLLNYNSLYTFENIDDIRKMILDVIEKMVTVGVDTNSKCLGAYYVLGALTLVNNDAAVALPWLYQAVY